MDSSPTTTGSMSAPRAKSPGLLGWLLIALIVAASIPGVIQAILRLSDAAGVNAEIPILSDADWLTGLSSFYGPRLAIVPLLIATVLGRIGFKYKVMLWIVFLLSLVGLLLFGQDIEQAFGSSPV